MEANKLLETSLEKKNNKKLKTLDSYTGKLKLLEVFSWVQ